MDERSLRIKKLIEDSGLSYQELEKLTGVKKSSLQRYASGTTSKIPFPAIEKIAKTFNVDPRYILGWEEEQKKEPTVKDDGLSNTHIELIELARTLSEEDAAVLLAALKAKHK